MNKTTIALILTLSLAGCSLFKKVARTAVDVGSELLCQEVAAEQPEEQLDGLTPEQWCALAKNLRPFADALLAAKREATETHGFSRGD